MVALQFKIMRNIIGFLLLFWTFMAVGQEVSFTASVSNTTVAIGEEFEVSFTVNGNIEKFGPPTFEGFEVVSGPNQSSSMTSINGKTSVSVSLSYGLVAQKVGEFTLGPASMQANGKQYRSNTIRIKVIKGSANSNRGAARGGGDVPEGNATDISKRLFIRAVPSKREVYMGEQLAVSYKLYTNIPIVSNMPEKMPDLNGFWSQDVDDKNPHTQWTDEVIDGVRYKSAVLKQYMVYPERFGKLTLDPLEMSFVIRQTMVSNDPIEQFFGGSYKDVKYKAKSIPLAISIKPLPEVGKPASFQGAVGKFTITGSVDKQEVKANEAFNYSLKVSGTGNLQLLKTPEITVPADIEKYDPKINDQFNKSLSGISGSREFSFLMIPRHEGNFKLPSITFSYFDPSTGKYTSLTTSEYTIKVAKGDPNQAVTAYVPGAQQDVKTLDKDIRYIKTTARGMDIGSKGFFGSVWFYIVLLLGPLLFIAALGYRSWYKKNNSDAILVKGRKANKIAAKHLATAYIKLQAGDKQAFYEAIYKGLYGYLSDKFNIPVSELNKEMIHERLRARASSEDLVNRLDETLDLCEMARFAPVSAATENEVYEKAKNIIHEIEKD
ncbi:Oxygen tolerance [bacterium A37T11]|nr:Oxygen tolerance [bacterium A37T11]